MKNFLLLPLLCLFTIGGCKEEPQKPCPAVAQKALLTETAEVAAYLKSAGIAATEDPMGYFYILNNAGNGSKPHGCSDIVIDYRGTLTNGTEFDAGEKVSFPLDKLILGWQMGLPKIGEGGEITLYLPPSLAYGEEGSGSIPPHSILLFKITLHQVES